MIVTTARQRRRTSLPDGSILFINGDTTVIFDAPRRLTVQAGEVFVEVAPDKNRKFVINTPEREVVALGTKFSVHAAPGGTGVFVTQGSVRMSGVEDPIVAGERILEGEEIPERAPRAPEPLWWVGDLMQASEVPLVPKSQYGGGAITIIDRNGQEARLSMEKYLIDVHIEDGFARTTIDQTYFNHTSSRQEGTFYFPLPPDASLSRLAMYVNNKLMEGGMVERNRARDAYETIRYQRRDPALLEWVDGSTFKMRVFPLEPQQEKRIILSYTQRLNNSYGNTRYRFPGGHNMSKVGEWAANIHVKNGQGLLGESPSHRFALATDGEDQVFSASAKDIEPDRDILLNLHRGDGNLFFDHSTGAEVQHRRVSGPPIPHASLVSGCPAFRQETPKELDRSLRSLGESRLPSRAPANRCSQVDSDELELPRFRHSAGRKYDSRGNRTPHITGKIRERSRGDRRARGRSSNWGP